MNIERLCGETYFEHKLRLIKAKYSGEIDLDWAEIAEILNEKVSTDHFRKVSYGILEYEEYLNNKSKAEVGERILCISDAHVPFNLPANIFKDYAGIVDTLIFNGDIEDCQSISTFPKSYRIPIDEEMALAR